MGKSLKQVKEELEIEKLKQEIRLLKKPWFTQAQWYNLLSTLIIGTLSTYILLRSDAFQAEKTLNKIEQTSFNETKDSLYAIVASYEKTITQYKDSTGYYRSLKIKVTSPEQRQGLAYTDSNASFFQDSTSQLVYNLSCDQVCARGHYFMRGAIVMEAQDEFTEWFKTTKSLDLDASFNKM